MKVPAWDNYEKGEKEKVDYIIYIYKCRLISNSRYFLVAKLFDRRLESLEGTLSKDRDPVVPIHLALEEFPFSDNSPWGIFPK